jgi:hypothetical protein
MKVFDIFIWAHGALGKSGIIDLPCATGLSAVAFYFALSLQNKRASTMPPSLAHTASHEPFQKNLA